jgi:outer membrane protein assembly factor BamB
LKLRGVSTPVEITTAVVVGDFKGYLHWLDKATGALVARERVAKYRVGNEPVASGDTVVVLDDDGKMAAYRADTAAAKPPGVTNPATQPIAPPAPPPKKKKDKHKEK